MAEEIKLLAKAVELEFDAHLLSHLDFGHCRKNARRDRTVYDMRMEAEVYRRLYERAMEAMG